MKKLLIKWFKLKPELVVQLNEHNKLHIVEVEKETSSIVEGLGLTREKEEELGNMAMECYRSTNNVVACMEKASKFCKHPNELFFVSYIISSRYVQNNINPGVMLAKMIIGRMGDEGPSKD